MGVPPPHRSQALIRTTRGAAATELVLGGVWSAYWYNGKIYGSDITRGLDVFQLSDPLVAPAQNVRFKRFNAQSQPSY